MVRALRTTVAGVGLALVVTLFTPAGAQAQEPSYTFSPDRWDVVFDFVQVGESSAPQRVTIRNGGGGAMPVRSVSISGRNPADFAVAGDSCSGQNVEPGASCQIDLVFRPREGGTRVASVLIDTAGCANWIHLAGSGHGPGGGRGATARAAQSCRRTITTAPQDDTAASRALPAASCEGKRKFRIRLNLPRKRYKRIRLKLGVRRFTVQKRGRRITSVIDLRGLPARRYKLKIRAVTRKGKVYKRSRTYVTCGKR
jgi:hypothetical protein